jgi:cell division protein FtsW
MSRFTFKPQKTGEESQRSNALFLIAVLMLWGLGIFTLLIATPDTASRLFVTKSKYYFVQRQLVFSAVGFAGFVFFTLLPFRIMKKYLGIFVLGVLALCFFPMLPGIGTSSHGAARWVIIPHLGRFQPSEFAKFAVVLYLANLFEKYLDTDDVDQKNFLYPMLGLFAFVLVVFLQKDFSTGLFIFIVGCVMFFISGAKMNWFGPLMLLAIPLVWILIAIEPYRLNRLLSFFNPDEYALSYGYQRAVAARAITSGGIWGNGLGTGMTGLNIPEIQTDYIFAGWSNAMGFVGVIAYFGLLIFFAFQGYKIAFMCQTRFGCYGAFGCTTMILLQSLMNVAVVCGVFPTTGIPLPFFSSGGSSLFVTLCMCGFILNAAHALEEDETMIYEKNDRNKKFETFNGVVVDYE